MYKGDKIKDEDMEMIKNILFEKNFFEEICDEILKEYTIDDILKPLIDEKKIEKLNQIKEHLEPFLTKIEFKIKDEDNKKLKQNYSKIFDKIVEEYKKGKLETIYYEDISNIFKEFKLEETETIKFYYKTDNGNEEITTDNENNKFFEKNVNNIIYVEFPEDFYINNDDEEEVEEEIEETEKNKGEGGAEENNDKKTKKGYCSQKNKGKNESKNKTKNESKKKGGCCKKR